MAETRDQRIGRNLTALRGDHSQEEVAQAMREAGFRWTQTTVYNIEKGGRQLRLAEAIELQKILNSWHDDREVSLEDFDLSPDGFILQDQLYEIENLSRQLLEDWSELEGVRSQVAALLPYNRDFYSLGVETLFNSGPRQLLREHLYEQESRNSQVAPEVVSEKYPEPENDPEAFPEIPKFRP